MRNFLIRFQHHSRYSLVVCPLSASWSAHKRRVDGQATTALPAQPPAAAGPDAGRLDRVLMRTASDMVL
jgi:hypothetical protein